MGGEEGGFTGPDGKGCDLETRLSCPQRGGVCCSRQSPHASTTEVLYLCPTSHLFYSRQRIYETSFVRRKVLSFIVLSDLTTPYQEVVPL